MAFANNQPAVNQTEIRRRQVSSAVSWLYFIAGLTMLNAIMFLAGSNTYFAAGVFFSQLVTSVISALIEEQVAIAGVLTSAIVLLSAAIPAVLFALFAWLVSKKRSRGAAIAGLVLLSADMLLFLVLVILFQSFDLSLIIDVAIHGIAIYSIARCIGAVAAPPADDNASVIVVEGGPVSCDTPGEEPVQQPKSEDDSDALSE